VIFVTVGTNEAPFDRLLHVFETSPPDEELVVQHGPSLIRPPGATCVDYLAYEELAETIRRARVVVTHAGVGSIMTALANGKRPVVVPRLREFGEAVDDHQVELGRRLQEAGLVAFVDRPADLPAALDATDDGGRAIELQPDRRLVAELRDFVNTHARERPGDRGS
jgi:UDP-N-acetylglucosamine transferase subunit ALG13